MKGIGSFKSRYFFSPVSIVAFWCASASLSIGQEQTLMTCAAGGKDYTVGQIACIPACHGRQRLAKCERTDKGTNWTSISDNCPSASLPLTPVEDGSFLEATLKESALVN